jgi:hypothetical protein
MSILKLVMFAFVLISSVMCYSGTKIYFDPAEISKTLNEMPKFQDTP